MTYFVCEVCTYPSRAAAHCDNPACLANPTLSEAFKAELLNRQRKADEARKADETRRTYRASLRRSGFTTAF